VFLYSDIVKTHFANPRNVGVLDHPDRVGVAKNEVDGDHVQLHFRLEGETIVDVRMKVMGCVAAIAATSMFTEIIYGMKIDEAKKIDKNILVEHLGGLPEQKIKCSLTCLDAFRDAFPGKLMPPNEVG
jgi:NifU-like protein involved in Fe-S cluster formation